MARRVADKESALDQDLPEPGEWLERYGHALYRYAFARLRRRQDAEDAVQETLLAALRARAQFQKRCHPQTWLIGIMKRKVLDRLRAAARTREELGTDLDVDTLFDRKGHWRRPPRRWKPPAEEVEWSEFWGVVRGCLDKLPALMAAAFMLRTLDDVAPGEVCQELDISPNNMWVLLHRARLRLVRCLQVNWFNAKF
jgi:RNA polymerase sigma-70 factor (ECF subfamily)